MPPNVIEFRQVSKSYPVYSSPKDRLKELLTFNRMSFHDDFWALRDVSFTVQRGETFCIVGENGSGKSTLLQIVARILTHSEGEVDVKGRVAALLELGSGFNSEFTGRENVYLNASILGLTRREIDAQYESITSFAEIGSFIDQPVRTYSSGMVVRLAFSIAIHVDPEILIVDEALAVGDIYFRQRCMRKVHELRQRGVTIVFVSHALGDVKQIGDRCMWLDKGRVRALGAADEVIGEYLAAMTAKDAAYLGDVSDAAPLPSPGASNAPEVIQTIPNVDRRHGDGRAEITGIAIYDEYGSEVRLMTPGTRIILRISAMAKADLRLPNIGYTLRNHLGIDFAASNTTREGHQLPPMRAGDTVTVDFHIDLPELYPGDFSFSPAIANGALDGYAMCDWIDNALVLQMGHSDGQVYGFMHLPCRVEVNARLPQAERKLA